MFTQIEQSYLSKRREAILNNRMYKHNRENAFLVTTEKQAIKLFDPLRDYQSELLETYKTVLQEIGVSYPIYMARHNTSKASN